MGWFDDCGVNGDAYSTQDTGEYTTKTTANGTVRIPKRIKKFLSGFNGNGWSIWKQSNGKYKGEFDDLQVRGSFTIFELIISQIRAIRGSQAITQGQSKIKSISTYTSGGVGYYRLTIEEDTNSIMEHDFIRCQKGGKMYHVEVASVGATYIDVKMSEFNSGTNGVVTNPPEASDEVVQFGNSSHDAKYAKRHSAIYMHVDDGEPAIDFMENIYSKDWSNTVTIRLGGNLPNTGGKRGLYSVNGKLFAVDANNNKIYEINPDGSGMFGFGAFHFSKDGIVFSKDAKITWNNFIDEYIANGTTIGSKFVASPTGFFGTKGSNGKLTGVLMGKNVTVNGATRTGVFALVDDVPVFELDPITKKYKFIGEIQATSGKIGAFDINGANLENNGGDNWVYISYVGGDQKRYSSLGNNMPGISGIDVAGYFESSGTGENRALMVKALNSNSQFPGGGKANIALEGIGGINWEYKTGDRWKMPGVFKCLEVWTNTSGAPAKEAEFGNGCTINEIVREGSSLIYRILHDIGHKKYFVVAIPSGTRESGTWEICSPSYLDKTATSIGIQFKGPQGTPAMPQYFTLIFCGEPKSGN